ncbi:hypothetical protein GGX14DRAFT_444242 [Mycena pura]|uniref:MYND-type domain-containing protein n=1 Tax=Mycena pura TaxID=153505 RepID=A0AAD6VIE0_9AGAR|nr:hypothetical protein GGX14DRAFT_444242 [Mycena pura]
MEAGLAHADNLLHRAEQEFKERKARKRDRKTLCGRCGEHKNAGTRLQTCSRCRCTPQCQKEDWKAGHKTDCGSFKHPPLCKGFDPSDRPDVPWPVDPIFAQGTKDGLGVWLTPSGDLSSLLQQAFEPADGGHKGRDPMGPPSFQRWAKTGDHGIPGPETKKYLGCTLLGLRVVVQNRRKDEKVVMVDVAKTVVTVGGAMKDALLPEDRKKAVFDKSSNGVPMMAVPPWTDYNGELRAAILEINGSVAPKGQFGSNGEYERPQPPTGEPWGRVLDWKEPKILLAPGDFVVFRLQYRLGDGSVWQDYPEIMTRFAFVIVHTAVLQPRSNAVGDAWISAARLASLNPSENLPLIGRADFDYVQEYYRPFFEEDSDVWAEKRLGGRAKEANDMIKTMMPAMLETIFGAMTPENRAEATRRFQALGFDIEAAMEGVRR